MAREIDQLCIVGPLLNAIGAPLRALHKQTKSFRLVLEDTLVTVSARLTAYNPGLRLDTDEGLVNGKGSEHADNFFFANRVDRARRTETSGNSCRQRKVVSLSLCCLSGADCVVVDGAASALL